MTEPAAETFRDSVHVFPVRVYYEDTDAAGIVYYANYLRFAERARTEMMRAMGIDHSGLMVSDGIVFAVRRCTVEFIVPARLDDYLEVNTRLNAVRGASLEMRQAIRRNGVDVAVLDLTLACMTPGGRPSRIPEQLRRAFDALCGANG